MENTQKKRKKPKKIVLPGVVIMVLLLLMMAEFIVLLLFSKMLPMMVIGGIGIGFLIYLLIDYILVQNARNKVRFALGAVLAVLMIIVLVIGNFFILKGINTLSKISGANTQTSKIGVYVLTNDKAQTIEDAKDYVFGSLEKLDIDNSTQAIAQISANVGKDITTKNYGGVTEMIDGLRDGECGAIILNYAYLPVLEEMDGYTEIDSEIRELTVAEVVTKTVEEKPMEKPKNPDVMQIFISGIDTRGSVIINTRSDVNIIATVNTKTKQILLVSTPRDYFVPLPQSDGAKDKLTHAGIYGINCSMGTLNMLYDSNIEYYFKVNFAGFIDIIDSLGGITVYSDHEFGNGKYHYNQGANEVDGDRALAFARERHAFADGDRQRGRNQMAVIEAVFNKMISPELLINFSDIMSSVSGSFETNVTYDKIADLVKQQLAEGGSWNIVRYSVDGTGDTQMPYSMSAYAYVMQPDQSTVDKAKELMEQVYNDEIISPVQ